MTYKAYNLITLILLRLAGVSILLLGFEARKLGAGPAIWWSAIGWGGSGVGSEPCRHRFYWHTHE